MPNVRRSRLVHSRPWKRTGTKMHCNPCNAILGDFGQYNATAFINPPRSTGPSMRHAALLLLILATAAPGQDRPAGKIPVGKDTTILTGPLTPEGYVDYGAVVNERLGKGIRPEQNAMVLLVQAFGPQPDGQPAPAEFFKLLGVPAPPADGEYFTGLTNFCRKKKIRRNPDEMIALSDQLRLAIQRPWTAKESPEVAEWLKASEKQLALVVEASNRPKVYCPFAARPNKDGKTGPRLIGGMFHWLQPIRESYDALLARAMLKTAEGQFDAAWQDLIAC